MTRGEPSVGLQSGCSVRHGTWGTASWTLDSDCTLTINGGDTGSMASATAFGNRDTVGSVAHDTTDILINGSLILRTNLAFFLWPSLTHFRMTSGARFIPAGSGGDRTFFRAGRLASVDTTGWDLSQTTNMYGMFSGCTSLTSVSMVGAVIGTITNITVCSPAAPA
ncbi:hypothetical protein OZX73_07840 [Bifidobacterium sp. ESL0775]|uniref:hypothetical protein n=1 Tax=Bifidobacterium sp. ESL0775 TaxID=2983230 RepID=UPI0023F99C22|nr:hypothetical protein [Bifidobacterium sp. ESL0775]WEV69155.1 hypothetical protein OZX73_07840 [Bifidobacterium sp. ESL0775]